MAAVAIGLAPAFPWIVGARSLEGAFAAVLNVLVMAVAATEVPPRHRPVAIGVVTAAGTIGSLAGPQLGALILPADIFLCPKEFVLKPDIGDARNCEVVWRKGTQVAVRYI